MRGLRHLCPRDITTIQTFRRGGSPEPKTFLEFFAGVGLVHFGLKGSGWECAYANDISEKKEEMYRDEFPDAAHFHCEDIWKTDDVLRHITQRAALATASFPCVDLSLAGQMRGLEGKHFVPQSRQRLFIIGTLPEKTPSDVLMGDD